MIACLVLIFAVVSFQIWHGSMSKILLVPQSTELLNVSCGDRNFSATEVAVAISGLLRVIS
jgi:hypothetical protein